MAVGPPVQHSSNPPKKILGPFLYHLQFLQLENLHVGDYEVGDLHFPSAFTACLYLRFFSYYTNILYLG